MRWWCEPPKGPLEVCTLFVDQHGPSLQFTIEPGVSQWHPWTTMLYVPLLPLLPIMALAEQGVLVLVLVTPLVYCWALLSEGRNACAGTMRRCCAVMGITSVHVTIGQSRCVHLIMGLIVYHRAKKPTNNEASAIHNKVRSCFTVCHHQECCKLQQEQVPVWLLILKCTLNQPLDVFDLCVFEAAVFCGCY